jgi:hypothetical protein
MKVKTEKLLNEFAKACRDMGYYEEEGTPEEYEEAFNKYTILFNKMVNHINKLEEKVK